MADKDQLNEISKLKAMKYLIKNAGEDPNRAASNETNPKDRRSFDKKYNRALGRIRAEKILAKEQEQLDEGKIKNPMHKKLIKQGWKHNYTPRHVEDYGDSETGPMISYVPPLHSYTRKGSNKTHHIDGDKFEHQVEKNFKYPRGMASATRPMSKAEKRYWASQKPGMNEEQLDEGVYLDKHPWNGGDVTHRSSGKKGKVSYVTKEPTFSQMVPYRTMFGVKWEDGTSSEHKKEQLKKIKSVNEETQDMPIKELIVTALEETPSDFIETFDQAMRERILDRIENAKFETAINMFGDPEEVNEERNGRVKLHYPEHQRNNSFGKAFHGKRGTIVGKEGKQYRVVLDEPVHFDDVGKVEDDLWDSSYLKRIREEEQLDEVSKGLLGRYMKKAGKHIERLDKRYDDLNDRYWAAPQDSKKRESIDKKIDANDKLSNKRGDGRRLAHAKVYGSYMLDKHLNRYNAKVMASEETNES